jgi:hypothetical protein
MSLDGVSPEVAFAQFADVAGGYLRAAGVR